MTMSRFRCPGEWLGEYDNVGKLVTKESVGECLAFQVVISKQPDGENRGDNDVLFIIPDTWIDWEARRFLHPGPDYQVNGLPVWEWREISFKRRRYPESEWVENDIFEYVTESPVSFNEAKAEVDMLEESVRSGEVVEIKTFRKAPASSETAAGGHQGLSPSAVNYQNQNSAANAPGYCSSAASSHLQSYSAQSPRYLPSATSSPQPYNTGPVCGYSSSKAKSPLTTPAENLSGFYSPGLITSPTQRTNQTLNTSYTPHRDAAMSLSDLSIELPVTSRLSSDKDVNSSNRRFLSLTPSKRSRGASVSSTRVLYASSPSLSHISDLDDQQTGSPLRVRKDPNSGRKVVLPSQASDTHSTRIKTRPIQKATTPTHSKDSTPVQTEANSGQADASSSQKDETFTLRVSTNTDGNSSNFQETTIKFYNTVVKLLKDMVDPKLTKERVINDHHAHFRKVVADNLKLPINDPDQVEDLNNALLDMKLSVCLCFYQIRALRSLQSKDIIAKELMRRVFSDELCGRLTWKNRKADNRHTFGHLVNLNAVFGVVIQHVLEDNKQEPPTIASIIQTIQTARRLIAHAHGKKPKGDEPLPTDDSGTPGSRQLMVELDARMKEINDAMANYNP